MRCESVHLLVGAMGVFNLVANGAVMLTASEALLAPLAITLAAVAGFAQLCSP